MNQHNTGAAIRRLRKKKEMTQRELAAALNISDKTVSKWETGKGMPDIGLLTPLAELLEVSVAELLTGSSGSINSNRSANMLKTHIYVCPVCGNILFSCGDALITCCGLTLPALTALKPDPEHDIEAEISEDEYYVLCRHEMTRQHSISFFAALTDRTVLLYKLYPESEAEGRFKITGTRKLYWYCSQHGLFEKDLRPLLKKRR